jgi:hypothetical protein
MTYCGRRFNMIPPLNFEDYRDENTSFLSYCMKTFPSFNSYFILIVGRYLKLNISNVCFFLNGFRFDLVYTYLLIIGRSL